MVTKNYNCQPFECYFRRNFVIALQVSFIVMEHDYEIIRKFACCELKEFKINSFNNINVNKSVNNSVMEDNNTVNGKSKVLSIHNYIVQFQRTDFSK